MKITLSIPCLERLTCLFLFIMVEFEKVPYSSDLLRLKNGTHFPRYESLPKGYNVQMSDCLLSHKMLRHAVVRDKPGGLSVQPPPPPGKLAARLKSPFWRFLSYHQLPIHSLTLGCCKRYIR